MANRSPRRAVSKIVKILLLFVGKPRDVHCNAIAEEYLKRSGRYANCEMREIQPVRYDLWAKHPAATKVLLDPAGSALSSAGFTAMVHQAEQNARDLNFVMGGAEGHSQAWLEKVRREKAAALVSLSKLTMPHELARAVLAEQIYRALTGLRGHPYPR